MIGISLTEQGVALAAIKRRDDATLDLQHAMFADCKTIDDVGATLDQWVKTYGLKGQPVNFVLGAHMYSLILTEAPDVKAGELAAAMRWKVKDLIQFDLSDAVVDAFEIPGQKARGRQPMAYVVCAAIDVLRAYVDTLEHSQLQLHAIDIPALVQRNIACLIPEEKTGVVQVVLGQRNGTINLCRDGVLYLSRDVDVGWKHFESASTGSDSSFGLEETMAPATARALDSIILEVQRSTDYYESQFGQAPIRSLVMAPLPEPVSGLIDYLAANTGLMVRELDLNPLLGESLNLERAVQAQCLPAIGAALRWSDAA